jgi:hypothetical protein
VGVSAWNGGAARKQVVHPHSGQDLGLFLLDMVRHRVDQVLQSLVELAQAAHVGRAVGHQRGTTRTTRSSEVFEDDDCT